jgi:hypothetical protein
MRVFTSMRVAGNGVTKKKGKSREKLGPLCRAIMYVESGCDEDVADMKVGRALLAKTTAEKREARERASRAILLASDLAVGLGCKKYIVFHNEDELRDHLMSLDMSKWAFYDCALEGKPCRLFGDSEFMYEFNTDRGEPGRERDEMEHSTCRALIGFVMARLERQHKIKVGFDQFRVYWASSKRKCSFHWYLMGNYLWENCKPCMMSFMGRVCDDIRGCLADESSDGHRDAKLLLINKKDRQDLIIDMSVYRNNALLRLPWNVKLGDPRRLIIQGMAIPSVEYMVSDMVSTLLTRNVDGLSYRILKERNEVTSAPKQTLRAGPGDYSVNNNNNNGGNSVDGRGSDGVNDGGSDVYGRFFVCGSLRRASMLPVCKSVRKVDPVVDTVSSAVRAYCAGNGGDPSKVDFDAMSQQLYVSFGTSRRCIKDPDHTHKSNGCWFRVDLISGKVMGQCYRCDQGGQGAMCGQIYAPRRRPVGGTPPSVLADRAAAVMDGHRREGVKLVGVRVVDEPRIDLAKSANMPAILKLSDFGEDAKQMGQTVIIKSAMSTGKTMFLKGFVENHISPDQFCLFVTMKRTLAYFWAGHLPRARLYLHEQGSLFDMRMIIVQLDSLHRLGTSDGQFRRYDYVFLDEAVSLYSYLKSDTLKRGGHRMRAISTLEGLMRGARVLVCADANWDVRMSRWIARLGRDIHFYDNVNAPDTDSYMIFESFGDWLRKLCSYAKLAGTPHHKRLVVSSTNNGLLRRIYRDVLDVMQGSASAAGRDVGHFLINGDSPDLIKATAFDCNRAWKQFDLLCYSPTLGCGVSFDDPHFDAHFVLITSDGPGVLESDQMIGRIRRVRDGVRVVCIVNKKYDFPEDEGSLIDALVNPCGLGAAVPHPDGFGVRTLMSYDGASDVGRVTVQKDNYYRIFADNRLEEWRDMNHRRRLHIELMRARGGEVVEIPASGRHFDMRMYREESERQRASDILAAPMVSLEGEAALKARKSRQELATLIEENSLRLAYMADFFCLARGSIKDDATCVDFVTELGFRPDRQLEFEGLFMKDADRVGLDRDLVSAPGSDMQEYAKNHYARCLVLKKMATMLGWKIFDVQGRLNVRACVSCSTSTVRFYAAARGLQDFFAKDGRTKGSLNHLFNRDLPIKDAKKYSIKKVRKQIESCVDGMLRAFGLGLSVNQEIRPQRIKVSAAQLVGPFCKDGTDAPTEPAYAANLTYGISSELLRDRIELLVLRKRSNREDCVYRGTDPSAALRECIEEMVRHDTTVTEQAEWRYASLVSGGQDHTRDATKDDSNRLDEETGRVKLVGRVADAPESGERTKSPESRNATAVDASAPHSVPVFGIKKKSTIRSSKTAIKSINTSHPTLTLGIKKKPMHAQATVDDTDDFRPDPAPKVKRKPAGPPEGGAASKRRP